MGLISQYGASFATSINALVSSIDNSLILILKSTFVLLLILGVLLYYSHIGRRLGKDFLTGGVIIGLFLLFGVPYIQTAFC